MVQSRWVRVEHNVFEEFYDYLGVSELKMI